MEANYRGRGKWYKGKISRDRGDDTFDVDYDDGEKETRLTKDLIRLLDSDRPSSPSRSVARLEEGAKVEANYRGRGKWFKGKLSRKRLNGTWDVDYDDGEKEMGVAEVFTPGAPLPAIGAWLGEALDEREQGEEDEPTA